MSGDEILRAFKRAAILVARQTLRSPRARKLRALRESRKWSIHR